MLLFKYLKTFVIITVIITVIIGINFTKCPAQIMTLDSFLTIERNDGYYKMGDDFKPEFLIDFNKNASYELCCIQFEQAITNRLLKFDNEPVNALYITKNEEPDSGLGKALFNYYNKKMGIMKSDSNADFKIFSSEGFPIQKIMCSLLNQMPKGLKDTLISDMLFIHKKLQKYHPRNYSFFENIWDFLSNGFKSHTNYKNGLNISFNIGKALIDLGEDIFVKRLIKDLDTSNLKSFKRYKQKCYNSKLPKYELIEHKIQLTKKYNSIIELMQGNEDTFMEFSVVKLEKIVKPDKILISGNKALFWVNCTRPGYIIGMKGISIRYLMMVEYINENTVKVYYICTIYNYR